MVPFSVDTAIEFKLIIRVPAKYLEQRINIRLAADIPWLLTALASACPLDSAPVLLCGGANGDHLLDGMNQELNVVITGHPFHTGHTELHFALLEGYSRDSLLLEHDLKNAPHLEIVIDALEKQVDLLTEGVYQKFAATHENLKALKEIRYWHEIQEIWSQVNFLREGRYYENEKHHYPGIPRIETIGKRLVDMVMDLVWRMDNNGISFQEELFEAFLQGE